MIDLSFEKPQLAAEIVTVKRFLMSNIFIYRVTVWGRRRAIFFKNLLLLHFPCIFSFLLKFYALCDPWYYPGRHTHLTLRYWSLFFYCFAGKKTLLSNQCNNLQNHYMLILFSQDLFLGELHNLIQYFCRKLASGERKIIPIWIWISFSVLLIAWPKTLLVVLRNIFFI